MKDSVMFEFLELERQLTKRKSSQDTTLKVFFMKRMNGKIKLINKFKRAVKISFFKIQRIKGIVRNAESASEIKKDTFTSGYY